MNSEGFRGRAGSWSWEQQSAPKPSVPFLLCREWGHQTIGALRMERSVMAGCGVWSERHSHSSLRWWHCSASPVSSSHIAATRWTLSPSRYRPSWGTSEGLLPSKHPPHIHEGSSASGPRGSVSLSLLLVGGSSSTAHEGAVHFEGKVFQHRFHFVFTLVSS